ncbi:hypothetical protein [Phyllobacterium zundukense]|uniref:hypothetical protein n=1 Tax=Phyllobacterium zundukense TaxID=1867719 RepID=UPI001A9F73EC|nr:hypothetical protein [Phyllobacterium zundukense]
MYYSKTSMGCLDIPHKSRKKSASGPLPRYPNSPLLDGRILEIIAERNGDARSANIVSKSKAAKQPIGESDQSVTRLSGGPCVVVPTTPLHTLPLSPFYSPSTRRIHSPVTRSPKRTKALEQAVVGMPDPYVKQWRHLWQHEKLAASFEALGRREGLAFTLKLSPARERMLLNHVDPANQIARYIGKEMTNAFNEVLPYSFTLEFSPSGVLHLHGAIQPQDRSKTHIESLKGVLMRAGGKCSGKAASRQCVFRSLTDGLGWAAYLNKAGNDAAERLMTNKVTFISNNLRKIAERDHKQFRQNVAP